MSLMDDPEIREAIFLEMGELIDRLEQDLERFEKDLKNIEYVKRIFRYVHTIKGHAGMLESKQLINLVHKFEDLLGQMRDKKFAIKKEMFPVFYDAHSMINRAYKQLKNNEPFDINVDAIIKQFQEIIKTGTISAKGVEEKGDIVEDIRKEFVEEENIRVKLNKIDYIINLLGELHLTNRMHIKQFYNLKDLISDTKSQEAEEILDELENKILKFNYLFDEFRENLLNIRMVKVSTLYNRFPKLVRDLSRKLNKKIEIKFEGDETEIDKRILEQASEPLLHIIRNAIDHGIETPDIRKEIGKSETGKIFIKTYPQGGNIIIEISDDGAGIDVKKIKEKLIEKKIFSKKELSTMSKKELINSIFLPGFSTKEEVSELSGRGVGMDIVAEKVKNLKGEIEIDSKIGAGTIFKIILPMTLSIIDGFSVELNNQEYLFVKDEVKFILKLTPEQIETIGDKNVVDYKNTVIPIYDLHKIFRLNENNRGSLFKNIVVVEYKDGLYGFEVDKLEGIKSIVLKSISSHIKSLKLFEGVTINEDGRAALVISKSGIIEHGIKSLGY